MNRITFSRSGEIRPAAVVLVGLVLSAIAFAIDMLIANAVPAALGAPGEASQFGLGKVALATIPAVLGNALGFYTSYRSHGPRALAKFLLPAAGFYMAFMVPHVWGLLAGGTLTAFVVGFAINTVAVAVAVPALLALRPGPRPGSAPAASPSNAERLRAETAVR
ncbi:MAG: hypothetical protein AVDCRST_MAG78-3688 [uncultured Rubrobacteraceae bacterium]|uniref:Major facilitator superfamily (MFS) profile domain-containing protein n=1 Tax=uncultured Rubrobacteraceae bacterium TaxID=349277 RepID=A0A6J4QYK9_9ACTN|nr:MAG: hypothetical protein AVDCRST_MAG78-3688 [uncultured Rubrobacteraceae bacterium]